MGDDLADLPVMSAVGLAASVCNGHADVVAQADWVSTKPAATGCPRTLRLHPESQGTVNRWSDRIGTLLSVALLGALAAASYLLSEWALQPDWQKASATRTGPTAYVYGASITRTNEGGTPAQRVQTPRITQMADGQSIFRSRWW